MDAAASIRQYRRDLFASHRPDEGLQARAIKPSSPQPSSPANYSDGTPHDCRDLFAPSSSPPSPAEYGPDTRWRLDRHFQLPQLLYPPRLSIASRLASGQIPGVFSRSIVTCYSAEP